MIAWLKQQWAPILLTLIACSVLLTNLGGQDLTLDEPDTIAVARTIGTYGFPSAWDGTAFIDVEHNYTKIGENYVWTWHPWLQHYIAYGMLLVPGIESSNIGALRLPFALFGIGTVLIAYALTQSLYNNRKVSFLVGLSIMLCLPFFLHIRQIRYYAPTAFFSLVCAYYYIKVLKSRSFSQVESFLFIGSFVGLFLSNYVAWGSSALLLGIALIYRRKLKLLCYVMLVGLGAFTWYIYFQPYAGDATRYIPSFIEIAERVGRYFFYVNSYISPGVILTFAGVLALIRQHWLVGALILWVGTKIVLYASLQTAQGRYIVDVVPVILVIAGYAYTSLFDSGKKLTAYILFAIVAFTNLFSLLIDVPHVTASSAKVWPSYYVYELTQQYPSVVDDVGEIVATHTREDSLFWSNKHLYNLYLASGMAPLYTNCSYMNEAPEKAINLDKVDVVVIFDPTSFDTKVTCRGEELEKMLNNDFVEVETNLSGTRYHVNQTDIVLRDFPPQTVKEGDIEVYVREK